MIVSVMPCLRRSARVERAFDTSFLCYLQEQELLVRASSTLNMLTRACKVFALLRWEGLL